MPFLNQAMDALKKILIAAHNDVEIRFAIRHFRDNALDQHKISLLFFRTEIPGCTARKLKLEASALKCLYHARIIIDMGLRRAYPAADDFPIARNMLN